MNTQVLIALSAILAVSLVFFLAGTSRMVRRRGRKLSEMTGGLALLASLLLLLAGFGIVLFDLFLNL